jgi:hypothetical protein
MTSAWEALKAVQAELADVGRNTVRGNPHGFAVIISSETRQKVRDALAGDVSAPTVCPAGPVVEGELRAAYPRPCGLCPSQIESQDDLDWHGLGNCVPICERCVGSGIEPDADKIKESYDRHASGIIQNLAMLVRRLAYKHANEKLKSQALDYLRGEGLQGDVLRARAALTNDPPPSEHKGGQHHD